MERCRLRRVGAQVKCAAGVMHDRLKGTSLSGPVKRRLSLGACCLGVFPLLFRVAYSRRLDDVTQPCPCLAASCCFPLGLCQAAQPQMGVRRSWWVDYRRHGSTTKRLEKTARLVMGPGVGRAWRACVQGSRGFRVGSPSHINRSLRGSLFFFPPTVSYLPELQGSLMTHCVLQVRSVGWRVSAPGNQAYRSCY